MDAAAELRQEPGGLHDRRPRSPGSGRRASPVVGTRPIRPDGVDKVTGRAAFGADFAMPGMIWSAASSAAPTPTPASSRIDTKKALALPGVKAVVTGADFPDLASEVIEGGEAASNMRDLAVNVIARDKALYDGHAVAAVAAVSPAIAEAALDLIEVTYEVLPHVIDVEAAMAPDAPLLHDHIFTEGLEERPTLPSNIARRHQFVRGDVEAGFAEAEVRRRGPLHHRGRAPGLHRAARLRRLDVRRRPVPGVELQPGPLHGPHLLRQGAGARRLRHPRHAGRDRRRLRRQDHGLPRAGRAGPLARSAGAPVKMVMTRDEVFRATGPTSGGVIEVKLGATKDGTITAAEVVLKFQAGAFPGSPVGAACMTALACYDIPNFRIVG